MPLLSVGETASVTVPPALAYGARGKPPSVPSNATLTFSLELVAIVDSPEAELL